MPDEKTWADFWVNSQKGPETDLLFEMMRAHGDINYFLHLLYYFTKHRGINLEGFSTVVELGVRSGCSTCAFATAVRDINEILELDSTLYSVDIAPCPDEVLSIIRRIGCQDYWQYIQEDDMTLAKSWDRPIDVLFIDTSHEYEHTKAELQAWGGWVRKGGLILLHDTHSRHRGVMVPAREYVDSSAGILKFSDIPLIAGLGIIEVI